MKTWNTILCILCLFSTITLKGQESTNCFLIDFEPRYATIPPYEEVEKTTAEPNVTVEINTADTLGKVSKYIFGNAMAVWVSQDQNNPVLVDHLSKLSSPLLRFPGGSWSDIYFWNGNPGDLPGTIPDGTNSGQPIPLNPQFGPNYNLTFDRYLDMRDQLGVQGLITINYGYARYGLGERPVEQAAHLAADWVRYDGGRTKFWEIGNENAGPWEAGWQIDTTLNKDGQPEIIDGELYAQHFKVFADSMRAAAAELDETIYIGGQILHYDGTNSWNVADRGWNESFFREVGDTADFYVIHNYFGNSAGDLKGQVDNARSEILSDISFIRQDIIDKQAYPKPIAMTEWNMDVWSEKDNQKRTSIANGMQAVVLLCEMIKNNYGMSTRWLVANWESDGMFYFGADGSIPTWNPRPDYYYIYYLQRFVGDHAVSTSYVGSSRDVLAYATLFASGEIGFIAVNKGNYSRVVRLDTKDYGVGERYYIYSLRGSDGRQWPQGVFVNDEGPIQPAWGPLDVLEEVEARSYPIGDTIKFESPGRSVQYVLIESGDHIVHVEDRNSDPIDRYTLLRNYPNPFNPQTTIYYSLPRPSKVRLKVYDINGREVDTLVSDEFKGAGNHQVIFFATDANGTKLPSGVYSYKLETERFTKMKKMTLIR